MKFKKLMSAALALAMLLTVSFTVSMTAGAENELPTDPQPNGTGVPEPWVEVNDNDFTKVRYFLGDGTDVTEEVAAITNNGGTTASGGHWQYWTTSGHNTGGTSIAGNYQSDIYVEFTFEGTAVAAYTQYRAPNSSDMEFYIDGELIETVTGISAENDTQMFLYFQKTDLAAEEHTLTMKAITAGVMTIDSFAYIPLPAEPTIIAGVVEKTSDYGELTTAAGDPTQALRIIFGNGWVPPGFEVEWGIGLLPKNEDGTFVEYTSPDVISKWYNVGADVMIDGTKTNVNWDIQQWRQDKNGDHYYNPLFQIPKKDLEAAGYADLWAAAEAGALVGFVRDVQPGITGWVEADTVNQEQMDCKANSTYKDCDAIIWTFQTSDVYYPAEETLPPAYVPETKDENTDAPTAAPTDAPDESADDTDAATKEPEDKGGCGSAIALAPLALFVLPIAFAMKKKD